MPSKYSVKTYIENGIYHVYNRGVEKRKIFQYGRDYKVFLHYLKRYLTQDDQVGPGQRIRWDQDLSDKLQLLAYCLMGNHFHLILKQSSKEAITSFMRRVTNAYTRYFNEKYTRVGALFQGKFKAVMVENDNYLLHLTRYIHLNPINHKEFVTRSDLVTIEQSFSSYLEYLGKRNTRWIHPEFALAFFSLPNTVSTLKENSYKDFVEDFAIESESILGDLVLES